MAVSILLGRLLGPDGYGVYAFTVAWAGVFSVIVVFGSDVLSTRELSRARARSDMRFFRDIIQWTTKRTVVFGSILAMVFAVTTYTGITHNEPVRTAIAWGAVLVPLLALLKLTQGQLLGANQILKSQFPLFFLAPSMLVVCTMGLTIGGLDEPVHALAAQTTAYASSLMLSLFWIRSLTRTPRDVHSAESTRKAWRKSCVMFATISGISVLNDQIGVLMLGTLVGKDQAGLFDIARRLSGLVAFALLIINTPLGPKVAEYFSAEDHVSLQRMVTTAARTALIAAISVSLIYLLLGRHILGLYGPGFEAAFVPLMVLCIGQIVNAGSGAVALILNMTGHERYALAGLLASLILCALLNLILIPEYKMLGSAIAASVAMILWNLILIVGTFRTVGINPTFLGRITH